jgi:molecular chaperone Hsp33
MTHHDHIRRLIFEGVPVRGEIVSIQTAWQHIVRLHEYPEPVRRLLGEMLAASALLSSTLKFDGSLIMQLHGDGPVKLLVCECHSDLGVRATAKLAPDADFKEADSLRDLVNVHGKARMAITLDPTRKLPGQQPYQGIVPLEGESIAQVLEAYMTRSEQIETRIWLASDANCSAGMLIQRLPNEGGNLGPGMESEGDWQRLLLLSSTIKDEELLELAPTEIAKRLFWEEQVRVGPERHVRFECSCNRDRVGNMLARLGRDEVQGVLHELGEVSVHCEFCNTKYAFDAVDIAQLFHTGIASSADGPTSAQH